MIKEQKLIFIPKRFLKSFQNEIKQTCPSAQFNQEDPYFNDIYINSLDKSKNNQTIQSKLAEIGLSDQKKINYILSWLKDMHESFLMFDQLVQSQKLGQMDAFSAQKIIDWKFEIFLHKKYLNNKLMTELLESFHLNINEPKTFFLKLSEFINIIEFQKFKNQVTYFLYQSTDVLDLIPEKQDKIYKALYHRNLCLDRIKSTNIENFLQNNTLEISLDILYGNIDQLDIKTKDASQNTVETESMFQIRVNKFLCSVSNKFADWIEKKKNQFVSSLYQQVPDYNYNQIVDILLNSKLKEFKSKEQITDEILMKIFNLSSSDLLNKNQPQSKSEVDTIKSSKKVQKPSNEQDEIISPQKKLNHKESSKNQSKLKNISQKKEQQPKPSNDQHQNNLDEQGNKNNFQKHQQQIILELNNEIKTIQALIKNQQCVEVALRELEIALRQQDSKKIQQKSDKLKTLINKYGLRSHSFSDIDELQEQVKPFSQKIPKIKVIRSKLYVLNLVEVFEGKRSIENQSARLCKNASAILIIGRTGAGKSTLLTVLAGYKLIFSPDSQDYRAQNPKAALQIPISNKQESQTRFANVKKVCSTYADDKQIIGMDTPGFDDNRGEEIDITNNLATKNLIKELSAARILIVLPKQQFFGARQLDNYTRFIKQFSNYFLNVNQISSSTDIILTKGLTAKQLLKTIQSIEITKTFQNISWNGNEKNFQKILKAKLKKLKKSNQIIDPSNHDFEQMMRGVMDLAEKQCPGEEICSSFSQKSLTSIKQTFDYLQKMVFSTFELGQFLLTKFYLNNIKELDEIAVQQHYIEIKGKLRETLQSKVSLFDITLSKFLSCNSDFLLDQLKVAYNYFCQPEAEHIYSILYENNQSDKTPKQICQQLISKKIKNAKQALSKKEEMDNTKKIIIRSTLKLMIQFGYQNDYQEIKSQISSAATNLRKKLQGLIEQNDLNEEDWQKNVKLYINLFKENQDINNLQLQKYQLIKDIVSNYINKNNQVDQIMKLKDQAMKQCLDGKLQKICKQYLGKLKSLKNNHYTIKELIEPKFNEILDEFDKLIAIFEEKRMNYQTINVEDFEMWENYSENLQEIFAIKSQFANNQVLQFNNLKQQESILKLFFDNLALNITALQKLISDLPQKPQQIDPDLIRQKLEIIFGLLEAMERKAQGKTEEVTTEEGKLLQKDRKLEKLKLTIKNSYRKINSIISSIERTCSIQLIRSFQINLKLMNSLTVVLQFKEFVQRISNAEMKEKLADLETKIIAKIQSPLESISKDNFEVSFAFQKLWKILKYMKNLDSQTRILGGKAINFAYTVDFASNDKINQIIKKCFNKIKSEYIMLNPIKELSTYGVKSSLKGSNSQLTSKTQHIDQLQYELLEVAVRYIKSYEFVKKINEDFSDDLMIVEDFRKQDLTKLDLKATIISRIQNISMQLKRDLTLQQTKDIKIQFNFFNKIHQNTKSSDQISYSDIEEGILQRLKRFGQNFDTLYDLAYKTYNDVNNNNQGVQFVDLQELRKHPGITVGDCPDKYRKLLVKIQAQYTKLLTNFYINEDPTGKVSENTNIFLNILEFKQICKDSKYECKLKSTLLQSGLKNLFNQLTNGFETILEKLNQGYPADALQVQKLISYEKKVSLLLKKQYDEFRQSKGLKEYYFVSFKKKIKQIQDKFMEKFSDKSKIIFNKQFMEVYDSTTPYNREKIKQAAIEKNQQEVEQKKKLVSQDHQKLFEFFNSKNEQTKNMPQEIAQALWKQLLMIKGKVMQIQNKNKQEIQEAVKTKTPIGIIVCFLKGSTYNNNEMKKAAVQSVKNYFIEEEEDLNLDDLTNFGQSLERNFNLTKQKDFQDACQKEEDFNNVTTKFVKTVKSKVQTKTKDLKKQIGEFKDYIKKKVSGQTFHSSKSQLDPNDKKIISKVSDLYKVIQKHPKELKEEIAEFKKTIQERVIQNNKQLKKQNEKLQELKRQILDKKVSNSALTTESLKESHASRQTCILLIQLSMVDPEVKKESKEEIEHYAKIIEDIKKDLKIKYEQATNWSLEEFANNENIISNSKQNEESQKTLAVLDVFMQKFFSPSEAPKNIKYEVQTKTKVQFQNFENSVLQDIDNFFRASVQCSSEKVMKYYKLVKKTKQSNSLRFSPDMKIDNKVKEKLLKKFKLNTQQIINFIEKGEKSMEYQKFLNRLKNIQETEKTKIDKLKKQSDIRIKEELKKIEDKIQSEKSTITNEDPDRAAKITKLEDQCKGDKLSKSNDLNELLEKNIEAQKKSSSKSKDQIINDLNNFLEKNIIDPLIIFQRAMTYCYCEKQIKECGYTVDSLCKQIQKKYKKKIFRFLYSILKEIDNPHAQALTQNKCFESIIQLKWRELVSGSTFETLMQKIPHLQQISKKSKFFNQRFQKFTAIYDELTEEYRKASDYTQTKRKLVEDTKIIGAKLAEGYLAESQCKYNRWELIARIAAIWTIQRSELDDQNNIQFIHRPHPGQILAIFLLLEFDDKSISKQIKNTMVQVSTGEGKSVILGILSTYLALVGFKVYEACYSNYLSGRDYNDFVDLFELFGVKDKIFYGTFPQICKMMLDESPEKTFVSKVQKLLINPSIWDNVGNFLHNIFPRDTQCKKVLLIDEADAFLDQNYLGENFFPSIGIKKKSVEDLLNFVWNQRQRISQLSPQEIIKSKEFDAFCKDISNANFRKLMQNQAHAMVRDLGNYKEDVYTLKDGQIYYKSGDSLTNKIHYGYRTVFNYYHEFYVNKRIPEPQFKKQVSINLIIASFSYSKLPSYFSSILGVTGTLDCMSEKQKKMLTNRFKVSRTFVQPSIYPPGRRKVEFIQCPEDKLLKQISLDIDKQHKNKRPMAVFFKSKNEVYHFYNSEEFSPFKSNATIVTHEVSDQDRTFRIETSTSDGKITLLTVDFSRGTDFKLNVKDANAHPGLHVVCSFLPSSYSDYLQLVGRTGRQGKNGTVKIFISDFNSPDIKSVDQVNAENMIKDLDNAHWNGKYDELIARMDRADQDHEESTNLYKKDSSADKIFEKMKTFNLEIPLTRIVSRTVIGIDATGSMGGVFNQLVSVIQNSLPIIYQVIEEAKIQGTFEIKWVIYRNYNSKAEELLSFSNFESKCENLTNWLKRIQVSGGWGNQALEVCLQHINTLDKVNQYVVITDAKGNHPEEIMPKRQQHNGNSYFTKNGFPYTTVKEEVDKLKSKNIKGHFFYLNPSSTQDYYKKLIQLTGGLAQEFKIHQNNSIQLFSHFISRRILTSLGDLVGGNGTEQLLQRYRARFAE